MAGVLIPLADGCEELEAVTLIDLLRRAGIKVTTASLEDAPVQCSRGTVLVADCLLDDVMQTSFDLLVLPGGLPGADKLNTDPRISQLLKRLYEEGQYIGAICAAPKVLVTHGLVAGHRLTAFPGALSALDTSNITLTDNPVETDGKIVTSRGPGTAMDFALHLIEILAGSSIRNEVEAGLQRT